MSFINSSSSSSSSNSSINCLSVGLSSFFIFLSYCVLEILLILPVCLVIIHLGLRRWRRRRRRRRDSAPSLSDIFTYNFVAMEMVGVGGCVLFCCGAATDHLQLMRVGLYMADSYGQVLLHLLTCVERYLAVLHPISYLGLKRRGGARNALLLFVWLVCLACYGVSFMDMDGSYVMGTVIMVVSVVTVSYCSLAVLCALIRPGPGEGGGDKERLHQSKKRAFVTILCIMAALLLRFGGNLLLLKVYSFSEASQSVRCAVLVSGLWFCLPSSLVLPLLFLHRAGKLSCCKNDPGNQDQSHQSKGT